MARPGVRAASRPPRSTMRRWRARLTRASSCQAMPASMRRRAPSPTRPARCARRHRRPLSMKPAPRRGRPCWLGARIEPLRFGPITAKQRLDRLLFYPDPHGIVAKQTSKLLAKRDETDIEPEKLAGASVAVQGFGAVDARALRQGLAKHWRPRRRRPRSAAATCARSRSTLRRSPPRRTPSGRATTSARGSPQAATTRST